MAKKPIQYAVVSSQYYCGTAMYSLAALLPPLSTRTRRDVVAGAGAAWCAFAAEPFKGNPASVCLLEDATKAADERWMQSVAAKFNLSETAFLLRDCSAAAPRFQLRRFTPAAEVDLCGHATLAYAHFLFTSVLPEHDAAVEFATKSGVLTAKKVPGPESSDVSGEGKLFIELDFPMTDHDECYPAELPSISENRAAAVSFE